MDLKGKTAIITGAGGGMGSLLARALKKEGVKLILVEKDFSLFEHLEDLFDGPETTKFGYDFTKKEEIEKLIEEIKTKYDKIDFLYHVAGVGIYKKLEELTDDDWELSLAINLDSPFLLTKGLLPLLLKSEKGMVLSFGSGMGKIPASGRVAYCASKFGLRGMSLSLAKEYEGTNLDFVLMTLGSVMTSFGTGGLEARKKLEKEGKKYLKPEEVIAKVMEITQSEKKEEEYPFYPEGYEISYE